MRKLWFSIFIILIGGVFLFLFLKGTDETSQITSMLDKSQERYVRQPAVAGQFYSSDKEELTEVINRFLEQVELPRTTGLIRALVVPHAGYVFSGPVAAYGFKAIQGQKVKTVILIGPSHHQYLNGAIIDGNDVWQTPLGQVDVDTDLRDILVKESSLFKIDSLPHQPEHCLEVEMPFLQNVLEDFKILPVLVGQLTDDDLEKISQTLAGHIDDKTLLVASSDMSHYPTYEQANYADKKVIEAVLTGQVSKLREIIDQLTGENIANLDTCLCGREAVEILMTIVQGKEAAEIKLLKYANSGDVSVGDKSQVVGYSSISFSWSGESKPSSEITLNQGQKDKLLEIAKTSVEKYILESQIPQFEINDSLLNEPLGAFVTLKRDGQLKGCLGRFSSEGESASGGESNIPLYQVISQMAAAAATQDARFKPIQASELNDLEYEISVLSPLKKIDDWHQIELGKHGVQIRQGLRSGVFLPQVATENNWDLDTFMGQLCSQKAGLTWDCWKSSQVDIYIFTAQVF